MTPRVTERILYKAFNIQDDTALQALVAGTFYHNEKGKLLTLKNAKGFVVKPISPQAHLEMCNVGYHAGTLSGYHSLMDERDAERGTKNGIWDSNYKALYRVLLTGIESGHFRQGKFVGRQFKIIKRIA